MAAGEALAVRDVRVAGTDGRARTDHLLAALDHITGRKGGGVMME